MTTIVNFILNHVYAAAFAGGTIGGTVIALLGPKLVAYANANLGAFLGREITAAESLSTGDPWVDGRLRLTALCLMGVANRKMPDAPGADKKAYVMGYFSKLSPAIRTMISGAIDELWATCKAQAAAGITDVQQAIIDKAVADLQPKP